MTTPLRSISKKESFLCFNTNKTTRRKPIPLENVKRRTELTKIVLSKTNIFVRTFDIPTSSAARKKFVGFLFPLKRRNSSFFSFSSGIKLFDEFSIDLFVQFREFNDQISCVFRHDFSSVNFAGSRRFSNRFSVKRKNSRIFSLDRRISLLVFSLSADLIETVANEKSPLFTSAEAAIKSIFGKRNRVEI